MAVDSITSRVAIYAHERGCRVKASGEVIGVKGKPRKTRVNSRGYLTFNLKPPFTKDSFPINVHKLAAYQIYGIAAFEEGTQVRHLNNIKTDNSSSNIAIGSQLDNVSDLPYGVANIHSAKLMPAEVLEIREKVKNGATFQNILDEYPIRSKSSVSHIVNRRSWKHI